MVLLGLILVSTQGISIPKPTVNGAKVDKTQNLENLAGDSYANSDDKVSSNFYDFYYDEAPEFMTNLNGEIVDCREEPFQCYELERIQIVSPTKGSSRIETTKMSPTTTTAYWNAFSAPNLEISWVSS